MKMIKRRAMLMALTLAVLLACSAFSGAEAAEFRQNYFSALPDVPLMTGMKEVEDKTVVFDKAQDEIIETAGFLPKAHPEDAKTYYRTVLGQLGWKARESGIFTRGNEQLTVIVRKLPEGQLVSLQFTLMSR